MEARSDGPQTHPAFLGIPGEEIHAISEEDGFAFAGLHAQRQQLGLGPLPQALLCGCGGHSVGGGLVAPGVLGAGRHDLLRLAEQVGEGGVDERRGVAELSSLGRVGLPREGGRLVALPPGDARDHLDEIETLS
ncbi:hypothetical protein [Streptomyces aureoversilis]|uniref:Uncharacterized protein n=1 Tax=Streptomyces aureoversilis TaxID=67277 RepID=A0ABV9ZW15_9ACTN